MRGIRARLDDRFHPRSTKSGDGRAGDSGFTLVELMVAMTTLMVLFGVITPVLTTYLTAGNQVISTYNDNSELAPNLMILARLIRSEVEPAPASGGIPSPPFVASTISNVGATFHANVGNANGPAEIVMASSTPTKCSTCKFYTSTFTLTEKLPNSGTCPGVSTGTACTYPSSGTLLVTIENVVNGQTNLAQASTPIFTYNTLNPTTTLYSPGTAISSFATCSASVCLADNIQSIEIDLQVEAPGSSNPTPYEENDFVVYRLSSSSYLYNSLVG